MRSKIFIKRPPLSESLALHLGVNCIAADEIRLEIQENGAIGLGAFEVRRDVRLMLAEVDEMLVVDARVFDMLR